MLSKLLNVFAVVTARTGRPEPAMKRAQATALVATIAGLALQFGVDISPVAQKWAVVGLMGLVFAGPFVATFKARKHTTPSDDPRDAVGNPLRSVPSGHLIAHPDDLSDDGKARHGLEAIPGHLADTGLDVAVDTGVTAVHTVGGVVNVAKDLVGGVLGLFKRDTEDENPAHVERAVQDEAGQ